MLIDQLLNQSINKLDDAGVPTARLDTLILLEDVVGKDRAWLLAHPEHELTSQQVSKLASLVARRSKHEPLAYIRGKSEFYGREFLVTPATLQPRAETETMIDLLKQVQGKGQRAKGKAIVDVGAGSGCLAITAKLEFPEAEVYATEINKDALKVAKQNAKKLYADVNFLQGNLLESFLSTFDFRLSTQFTILANLPYVPNNHTINQAAMQEPKVAIFGGEDGLDLYREMFEQIDKGSGFRAQGSVKPKYILAESLPFQHEELANIAKQYGYKLVKTEDFIQLFEF